MHTFQNLTTSMFFMPSVYCKLLFAVQHLTDFLPLNYPSLLLFLSILIHPRD